MKGTTTIKEIDDDDSVRWYKCKKCNYGHIMIDANYCPHCGRKIVRG